MELEIGLFVPLVGRKLAKEIACKFIETSSGLDHNVDELLVGIVAQVKLNPQRIRLLSEAERRRLNLQSSIQNHRRMHLPARRMVRQMSIFQRDDEEASDNDDDQEGAVGGAVGGALAGAVGGIPRRPAGGRVQQVRKANRRPLNLENILKMGESELEDEENSDTQRFGSGGSSSGGGGSGKRIGGGAMSKFEMLAAGVRRSFGHGNSESSSHNQSFFNENGPSTSAAAAAALARAQGLAAAEGHDDDYDGLDDDDDLGDDDDDDHDSNANNADCNRKVVTKLTARTKIFIASVLRFKKNMKRRNSSSCSDLFVI